MGIHEAISIVRKHQEDELEQRAVKRLLQAMRDADEREQQKRWEAKCRS